MMGGENLVKTALIYSIVTIYLGLRPRISNDTNVGYQKILSLRIERKNDY